MIKRNVTCDGEMKQTDRDGRRTYIPLWKVLSVNSNLGAIVHRAAFCALRRVVTGFQFLFANFKPHSQAEYYISSRCPTWRCHFARFPFTVRAQLLFGVEL